MMNWYYTFTQFGDTVEDEANSAFTAVRAHYVDTTMVATNIACTTLIYICNTNRRNAISLVCKREIKVRYNDFSQ